MKKKTSKQSRANSRRSRANHAKAVAWFTKKGHGMVGKVLHHKDTSMKRENPERYAEWRHSDLVPMTKAEHRRLHMKLVVKKGSHKTAQHKRSISKGMQKWSKMKQKSHIEIVLGKDGIAQDTFTSYAEAARFLGCTRQHVSQACKQSRKALGYDVILCTIDKKDDES